MEPAPAVQPEIPGEDEDPEEFAAKAPKRVRIDRLTDERTRKVAEFMSRNRDATIEDALEAVDGQPVPAPAAAPAGSPFPDVNGLAARITELQNQVRTKTDPYGDGFNAEELAALQDQLLDAKVELRFARAEEQRRVAGAQQQRVTTREASVNRAVEMCPEINDPATPQGKEFARLYEQYRAGNDPILHNDDCARLIALDAMDRTDYVRKSAPPSTPPASPAVPPAPLPNAVPLTLRPPVPVARNLAVAPVTAPGSARLAVASAPSPEAFARAIDEADGDTVSDLIDRLTPVANRHRKPFSMD